MNGKSSDQRLASMSSESDFAGGVAICCCYQGDSVVQFAQFYCTLNSFVSIIESIPFLGITS